MTTRKTTRRAVLAGAAAIVPATALALPPIESRDPIFEAIEAHKAAFKPWTVGLNERPDYPIGSAEAKASDEAVGVLCHAETEAAVELANVVPTTMRGVLALLDYIEAFNSGEFQYSDDGWGSEYELWPEPLEDEDGTMRPNGQPLELPWAFWIMRNIRTALTTAQS